MREQVCKYMCPYARFQSAMFDSDTLIVSYDEARGEPRGQRGRGTDLAAAKLGHCIDCKLCVHVCPVGIDIRDGLQYECIACTACIDACDGVMDKLRYPRGLIRYATHNSLTRGWDRAAMLRRALRPRVLVYGAILIAISVAFVVSLASRPLLRVDVVRDRGTLARLVGEGRIENVYRLQLMNAAEQPRRYRIGVDGLDGVALAAPVEVELGGAQARWVTLAVQLPPEGAMRAGPGAHPIRFSIAGADRRDSVTERSTFVVPR